MGKIALFSIPCIIYYKIHFIRLQKFIMKKKIFAFSLILMPFVLLALLEGILRLAGYGDDYPLFVKKGPYYETNQNFARKYFSGRDILIPQLIAQSIPVQKAANSVRIVTLGGSTTAGFPYDVNIGFAAMLREHLQAENPDKKIEVINLGISAINSHSVLDMLDQVWQIQPDLFLVYMGHNEFYGALGLASSQSIGSNRGLIRFTLWLRGMRFYQLLQNTIDALRPAPPGKRQMESLMTRMIGKAQIKPGTREYQTTLDNFKANLQAIISKIKARNLPVIISQVASNLRDQYPLGQSPQLQKAPLKNIYKQGLVLESKKNWQEAINNYQRILLRDSLASEAFYHLGNCYLGLGNIEKARAFYSAARDYDTIPFRAPSAINRIIHDVAQAEQIPLLRSDALFEQYARFSIPGNDLFLEHLHPNQKGYALLASGFEGMIPLSGIRIKVNYRHGITESEAGLSFTALDRRIGELKVKTLFPGFPFNGRSVLRDTLPCSPTVSAIAEAHIRRKLFWDAAHFKLGAIYQDQKQDSLALREYNAVYVNDPGNPSALYKIGDIYSFQNKYDAAIKMYRQALTVTPDQAYLYAKLGKTQMMAQKTDSALQSLEQVIRLEKRHKTMKDRDKKVLFYLMAVGYARQNKIVKARDAANMALSLDRVFYPALELKAKLKRLAAQRRN